MNDHSFWIATDSDGDATAFLTLPKDEFTRSPHARTLEDLMLKLYEGDEVWYLVATDAYGVLHDQSDISSVSLFDHEQVLFTYSVDADWIQLARTSQGFVLVLTYEMTLDAIRACSFQQLVEARDENKLELISIAVSPPSEVEE
jgi:hypothetical protein